MREECKLYEFRGVWVATVYDIDWPKVKNDVEAQKEEFIDILDKLQSLNLNAVFVQVRPTSDTFYNSRINPWSEYLTGTQGKYPGYDPLQFMIEETHKRNMQFHAWLNPYRITTKGTNLNDLADNNPAKLHPDWVLSHNNALFYNPQNKEVIDYLATTVFEIISKYDVDGIHFDEYFYPYNYPVPKCEQKCENKCKIKCKSKSKPKYDPNCELPCGGNCIFSKYQASHENVCGCMCEKPEPQYNCDCTCEYICEPECLDTAESRREAVKYMIKTIHQVIKATKPKVEFGVSPFGVWKNKTSDIMGSNTKALEGYYDLYSDAVEWINSEIVDYIASQVYWGTENKDNTYETLVRWWSNIVDGTNVKLYIGQNINKKETAKEVDKQIQINRKFEEVKGNILFSYSDIAKNNEGVVDQLKKEYTEKACIRKRL
ncbi:MAG: family 10 glycosylhydrolase [Peptostreptococcaceae bacterium]